MTDACRCMVLWDPRPKFTKFGERLSIGQTPNHVKFHLVPPNGLRQKHYTLYFFGTSGDPLDHIVHQSKWWCIARSPLSSCQISSRSDNPVRDICCHFKFVYFVDGVTDTHTHKTNSKRCMYPHISCSDNKRCITTRRTRINCTVGPLTVIFDSVKRSISPDMRLSSRRCPLGYCCRYSLAGFDCVQNIWSILWFDESNFGAVERTPKTHFLLIIVQHYFGELQSTRDSYLFFFWFVKNENLSFARSKSDSEQEK